MSTNSSASTAGGLPLWIRAVLAAGLVLSALLGIALLVGGAAAYDYLLGLIG